MALPVQLEEVASELQLVNDQCYAYQNRRTGETMLTEEQVHLVEDDVDEERIPEWLREILPTIREVLESDDWLDMPTSWDIHEYRIMERFCYSVENDEDQE